MASEKRTSNGFVKLRDDLLVNAPYYDFFVTVGAIERLVPEAVRVGGDGPPSHEVLRFRHDPSLSFKPSDVTSLERVEVPRGREQAWSQARHRFELTTSFMGLTGTTTPLPMYLAEEILQSQDEAQLQRDFLDIFHHRLVSFVYRVGIKYDYPREFVNDLSDPWSRRILALTGFDTWAARRPQTIPLWRMLRLAPVFAARARTAHTLEIILQDVCEEALGSATIEIEEFCGDWTPLDEGQRMSLGRASSALGRDTVLGHECYHRAGKATIKIGPLGDNFRRFAKGGDMLLVISEVLELVAMDPIEFDLDLVLAREARPSFALGMRDGGCLGAAWLSSRAGPHHATHVRVPLTTSSSALPEAPMSEPPSVLHRPVVATSS